MNSVKSRRLLRLPAVVLVAVLVAHARPGAPGVERGTDPVPATDQDHVATTQPTAGSGVATSQPAASTDRISGLIGSKHDFTQKGEEGQDFCTPCHKPHMGITAVPRLDGRPVAPQLPQPYREVDVELTGWSLLCLGCHDGSTAPDVYSSTHAVTVSGQLAGFSLNEPGLRSHPVGVKYPLASEGYHPSAAAEAGGLPLPDGRVQCTTCHDAHNTHGHRGMLRISNTHSRMCLTCHRR